MLFPRLSGVKVFWRCIMGKGGMLGVVSVASRCVCVCVCVRLSAGLFRQATYSTVRLGVYQSLMDKFTK